RWWRNGLSAGSLSGRSAAFVSCVLRAPCGVLERGTSDMIRLLIVDDHQLMRDGLVRLLSLEADIELVGTACDGAEAVRKVADLAPNLVLMDIRMPEMSGIAATREIKAAHPEVKVVLLTMHDEDDYVFEGIGAGASGYLLKDSSRDELISSIHRVHA